MSRDSGTDDEHYEEESMMSHIDYDESTSMNDMMEHYIDNGSSCMEDMVEHHYDIGSSSMNDMELYTDNGFPCMDENHDEDSLMGYHEYLSHMELNDYLDMQEEAHHQQAMTFPKTRGTYYDGTSSRPRYSPSSSRR